MNLRTLAFCAAALLPAWAAAQEAHSIKTVNLRAGPARDYPLVARLGPGAPLAVQGCTDGFGWCDVVGPDDTRGWVYAGNIAYPYQSADVPVISYGPVIGFPIVSFVIGDYWGRYYRGRPWYGNQGRWVNHRPPPRPIFRPPPPQRPIVRPPRPLPPGVGLPDGGGRPPGGGGGRPPGAGGGDGRPPGIGGGGRPPGAGGEGRPPGGGGRPPGMGGDGGGRPPGGGGERPPGGGGGRPGGPGGREGR